MRIKVFFSLVELYRRPEKEIEGGDELIRRETLWAT